MRLALESVDGLPEVAAGDDLAALIAERVTLEPGDVVCVAHKVVSKAEGRVVALAGVEPSARAVELATPFDKDPRQVEVVLREAAEVIRAERGVLIARTRHGFVCANAGVDASNTAGEDEVILLPLDPDASARRLRSGLAARVGGAPAPAVVISDSFGRAWRQGQLDVAIGLAGLMAMDDWRGREDGRGRELRATLLAVADALAAACELARAKDGAQPVVVARGLERFVTAEDGPGAGALVRPAAEDLFL